MSNENSIELDFDALRNQVHGKLEEAAKLIKEAYSLCSDRGYSLHSLDAEGAAALQVVIDDADLITEQFSDRGDGWSSSQVCW